MGATQLMGFVRIQGGVNSSKHHVRAASACQGPNFVAAQSIRGVDADTNDVARLNLSGVYRFQGLIDQAGITKAQRCGRRKNV